MRSKPPKEQIYNQKIILEDNSEAIFALKGNSIRNIVADRSGSESMLWTV